MSNRFETIVNTDSEQKIELDLNSLRKTEEKIKEFNANFDKIKLYLQKYFNEITSVFAKLNSKIEIKIGTRILLLHAGTPYYYGGGKSSVYFSDVIKSSYSEYLELIILTAEALPQIEQAFESIFGEKCDKLNAILKRIGE